MWGQSRCPFKGGFMASCATFRATEGYYLGSSLKTPQLKVVLLLLSNIRRNFWLGCTYL